MSNPLRMFLSYRRDHDAPRATLMRLIVEAALNRRDEPRRAEVFQDTQQRAGARWPDEVRERLHASDIVLAVVGPEWLGASDQFKRRRIDQDDDWVRLELEEALNGGKTVLPVVFECEPPRAEALPPSLHELATRQMVEVRDDYAENDLQPLLAELLRRVESGTTPAAAPTQTRHLPYPDPPLVIKPAALERADLQNTLSEVLPEWSERESPLPEDTSRTRHELFREFLFDSFADVVEFMGSMTSLIDNVNHHPRWENLYRTLRVSLSTWDIGHRISYADVMLAQAFDRSFAAYEERQR
jgi:pterin-4a-carbinolamine dehydratase